MNLPNLRVWLSAALQHDLADRPSQLRTSLTVGSIIGLIPILGLLAYNILTDAYTQLFFTCVLLVAVILNLVVLRAQVLSLWPSRLATAIVIFLIAYTVFMDHTWHTLFWSICVPPVLIYVYGRLEGFLWSCTIAVPCGIYVFFPGTFGADLPVGMPVNFVLAFVFSSGFALAFQSIYTATNKAATLRGEALAREEQRFRDFAAIGSDWLFEFDEQYRFTYVSANLLNLLNPAPGGDADVLVGRSIASLLSRQVNETEGVNAEFIAALEKRESLRDARFSFDVAGHLYTIDVSVNPIYEGDTLVCYRGAVTDVSAMAQRDEELRDKDRVLYHAQKMEAVGQLTSGLAHDFNNLLTVIRGNLDLLELDVQGSSVIPQVNAAQQATQRASELTAKLLAFARKQPLQPRATDAGVLVAGMTDMLERTLGEGVVVTTDFEEGLWPCLADAAQLESALLNLAINAREAMPTGGELKITLRNQTVEEDGYLAPGDYMRIEVADTGIGIEESIKELVFDPFFSTKPYGEGSGLGLSMVYGFARQSSGSRTSKSWSEEFLS